MWWPSFGELYIQDRRWVIKVGGRQNSALCTSCGFQDLCFPSAPHITPLSFISFLPKFVNIKHISLSVAVPIGQKYSNYWWVRIATEHQWILIFFLDPRELLREANSVLLWKGNLCSYCMENGPCWGCCSEPGRATSFYPEPPNILGVF